MNSPYPRLVVSEPAYEPAVKQILGQILPPYFFEGEYKLPLISWSPLQKPPFNLSFFLLCPFRENAFRFFQEMIRRWLIPGKQLNNFLQFALDFRMPDVSSDLYIVAEVTVRIETSRELAIVEKNLPFLERDLRLGVVSPYQATRILEIKGLSYDEKTALIQEGITELIKRRPQDFDYDILGQMQQFLVLCKKEFKIARSHGHMSRIICANYLFHHALQLSLDAFAERRYISVKLLRAKLHQSKSILGIIIGMSFLRENELFEERHVFSAIQHLVPRAQKIEGSYFMQQNGPVAIYLEIEKLTFEEERLLKEELPLELKGRIEQRLNPLFMPLNEEQIMRDIVTLSQQLQYARDLPQVMIHFTQQTDESLEFLVIMLRVKTGRSIAHYFRRQATFLEYLPDRCKIVGTIRKRHQKEAAVFHLRISKSRFLRQDHAIDLYKARQEVVIELMRLMGEFRDYNGGMISKEIELFHALRMQLGDLADENHFLLENFFFSLQPAVMRSLLAPEPLKKMFTMVLKAEIEGVDQQYQIRFEEDQENFYLLVSAVDASFFEALQIEGEAITCAIKSAEFPCMGIILQHPEPEQARALWHNVEESMGNWSKESLLSL